MTEYIERDGQVVDAATGEVLPDLPDDISAAFLAQRRHFLHGVVAYWTRELKKTDTALLARQAQETAVYGWIAIERRTNTVRRLNGEAFADMFYERYGNTLDLLPGPAKMNILETLAAAKDFHEDRLNPFVAQDYRAAREESPSSAWIQSSTVRPMPPSEKRVRGSSLRWPEKETP